MASSDTLTPAAGARQADSPLVSVAALADRLATGNPAILLDVRWSLAGADRVAFRSGHLPGAVFIDLDAELAGPPGIGGRHPLPEPQLLQQCLQTAGVQDDSTVVVYDERDCSAAARGWWLLRWAGLERVAVLDGGFRAWAAAGHPVQTGQAARPGGGSMHVRAGQMPTVDADQAAALATAPDSVLLDARAAERYRGEVEPVDPVPGHIPAAVNLPFSNLLEPDGRFRAPAAIAAALSGAGVGPGTVAAASCGSGVNACVLVLAGQLAGVDLALYPGSYSQWCATGRPVRRC